MATANGIQTSRGNQKIDKLKRRVTRLESQVKLLSDRLNEVNSLVIKLLNDNRREDDDKDTLDSTLTDDSDESYRINNLIHTNNSDSKCLLMQHQRLTCLKGKDSFSVDLHKNESEFNVMQDNDKTGDDNLNVPCPEENESRNTEPHDHEGDTLNTQEKTTAIPTGKTMSRKGFKTIYQCSNDVNIQVYNVTQPLPSPFESYSEDSVTKSPDEFHSDYTVKSIHKTDINVDVSTTQNSECNKGLLKEPSFQDLESPSSVNVLDMQEYGGISLNISRQDIYKNEVGYKQIRSNMMYDNRVRFHGSEVCYEGIYMVGVDEPTEEQFLNNITNMQQTSKNSEPQSNHDISNWEILPDVVTDGPPDEKIPGILDTFHPQPSNIAGWLEFSQNIQHECTLKRQSGLVQLGRNGHDAMLILDASNRMTGYKFDLMKSAAISYIEGVKQVFHTTGLEDNIGVAVFSGNSRLVHQHTSDYDWLIHLIGELKTSGDAPLVGGLIMGMNTVTAGGILRIGEYSFKGHMIVFTDGTSDRVVLENRTMPMQSSVISPGLQIHAEILSVIQCIASESIKIFYVPVGDYTQNPTMETAVSVTNGKIIEVNEIDRLVRMTQVISVAARVAMHLNLSKQQPTKHIIVRQIRQMAYDLENNTEECMDMVLEIMNRLPTTQRISTYKELEYDELHLGDRVRRGPFWPRTFGNQDGNLAGTVIGQHSDGWVQVEWDTGYSNFYQYDEKAQIFNLRRVNEPRKMFEGLVGVGCRVVRGEDWTYNDNDGGPGEKGTVLKYKLEGKVIVRWDCKRIDEYNMGFGGLFEVKLADDQTSPGKATKPFVNKDTCSPSNHDDSPDLPIDQPYMLTEHSHFNPRTTTDKLTSDKTVPENNIVWEYIDESEWRQFPFDITVKLEKAYKRKPYGNTNFRNNNTNYIIHFKDMVQEDPITKITVPIRRKECTK